MLKNIAIGIVIGLLVMGGIWGLVHLMGDNSNVSTELTTPKSMSGGSKGVMDLICELELDLDGQLALGIKENEPARVAMAQIDFEQKSGWYQGRIAISESRSGTLQLMGDVLRAYHGERLGAGCLRCSRRAAAVTSVGDCQHCCARSNASALAGEAASHSVNRARQSSSACSSRSSQSSAWLSDASLSLGVPCCGCIGLFSKPGGDILAEGAGER